MTEIIDKSRLFKVNHNMSWTCNTRGMGYKFEV